MARLNDLSLWRRRTSWALGLLPTLVFAWALYPGTPLFWGPSAPDGRRVAGEVVFVRSWEPHDSLAAGDGLGPVFNARSCVSCHSQGGIGGGGDNSHNVVAFEAQPTKDRLLPTAGLVHRFAVANRFLESNDDLRRCFPIVPGGTKLIGNCQVLVQDFDPVKTQGVNSTALFGAGWVDRIDGKAILHAHQTRAIAQIGNELNGHLRGIGVGRPRILPDGRLGRFGWKAQFATLEEFVAAACANELGLGNPKMIQPLPRTVAWYPEVDADLDREQFGSLVDFVATLPRPEVRLPEDSTQAQNAARGQEVFAMIGCAQCHTPTVGGLTGVYSDFLLHSMTEPDDDGYRTETDAPPLPHEYPRPEEWKTPALWGVADSAPYWHDGSQPTLRAAIEKHAGEGRTVTEAYAKLSYGDQEAVVHFLETLRAPASARPAPAPSPDDLAGPAERPRKPSNAARHASASLTRPHIPET
jgi:mono/diheme cytochrome c family protein